VIVPTFENHPETARGRLLYQRLLAVHALIRSEVVRAEQLPDLRLGGVRA
jgi:hypothetical protein